MHEHHKSFFPFILIGLTLALMVFMVFAFSKNPEPITEPATQTDPVVTDEDYRKEIKTVISDYEQRSSQAETDLQHLVVVEDALENVLAIKVSAGYRDIHLEIATSLFQIASGLRGEEGTIESGQSRLETIFVQNPWLK